MDSLIRKACELGKRTAHCRVEVILNATKWMEEKYRDVPNGKIAAMIALHYLMLAMRQEYRGSQETIEGHMSNALRWWETACCHACWNSPAAGREESQDENQ
jgi:hypothetical protein